MEQNGGNITPTNFFALSIIILIALYLIASTIVPFIPVRPLTFTIIFTLAGGIPALIMLFKEKYIKKTTLVKESE